jgi:hypothetical protein
LTRVQSKDYIFIEQLLEIIDNPSFNLVEEESFIQSLVTELITAKVRSFYIVSLLEPITPCCSF